MPVILTEKGRADTEIRIKSATEAVIGKKTVTAADFSGLLEKSAEICGQSESVRIISDIYLPLQTVAVYFENNVFVSPRKRDYKELRHIIGEKSGRRKPAGIAGKMNRSVMKSKPCFGKTCLSVMPPDAECCCDESSETYPDLSGLIENLDEGFSLTLMRLIDKKGMNDVQCYKKANVSKQTWYKIMNDGNYRPSKNTVLSFAVALELTLSETESLLKTAGYALSPSSKADVIIGYFINHRIYDIFEINEALYSFDQVTLGACV